MLKYINNEFPLLAAIKSLTFTTQDHILGSTEGLKYIQSHSEGFSLGTAVSLPLQNQLSHQDISIQVIKYQPMARKNWHTFPLQLS